MGRAPQAMLLILLSVALTGEPLVASIPTDQEPPWAPQDQQQQPVDYQTPERRADANNCRPPARQSTETTPSAGKTLLESQIFGGQEVSEGAMPWHASLLRPQGSSGDKWTHFCGGALISRRHVLTAAHCAARWPEEDLRVRLGSERFETAYWTKLRPNDLEVAKLQLHEAYNASRFNHDIAIVHLKPKANATDEPEVCLPSDDSPEDAANSSAIVAGYGQTTRESPTRLSAELLQAQVRIFEDSFCKETHAEVEFDPKFQLCAGVADGSRDHCQGDSGGPLVVKLVERHLLVGVVAYGYGCGRRPGVYTRTKAYWDWIREATKD